jgi:coenzyme F420-reducing hydrogenase beta subunit
MTHKVLKIKDNDVVGSTNDFLRTLLSAGKIQALLVPQNTPSKKVAFPVLISDPKKLHADIFSPVLPTSTSSIVSKLTKVAPPSKLVGVVMRSCQIRALIELVKLNQANLSNIVIIGVDCPGTFPFNTFTEFPEKQTPTQFLLEALTKKSNESEKYLRSACRVCKDPIPMHADIILGFYGAEVEKEIFIEAHSEMKKTGKVGKKQSKKSVKKKQRNGQFSLRKKKESKVLIKSLSFLINALIVITVGKPVRFVIVKNACLIHPCSTRRRTSSFGKQKLKGCSKCRTMRYSSSLEG